MPLQFQTVEEPSFGRGIDARSAENQIREGFVRDLVNADIVEGRVRKRKGYADFAGKIPVRVTSFRQVTSPAQRVYFRFDGSIDLSRLTSSPLLVYGRSSTINDTGSFLTTEDRAKYYEEWFTNITKVLVAETTGTISSTIDEHNIATSDIFAALASKPEAATNLTNTSFLSDLSINSSSYTITVDYTNGTTNDIDTYLFYSNGSPIVGEVFVKDDIAGASSITIDQGTHNLTSTNMRYILFKQDGAEWRKVIPENFAIDQASGDVTIGLVGDYTGTYKIILATVPQTQAVEAIPAVIDSTLTNYQGQAIVIQNVTSPYIFCSLYQPSGTVLNEIMPDDIWYDDAEKRLEIHLSNEADGQSFRVHFDYGTIRANELYVPASGLTTAGSDSVPQLTVYGLDHSTIYGEEKEVNRKGWVTHLDSYRSPNTTHMVAGLGGNLFAALRPDQMYQRDGITTLPMKNAMPTYSPRLNARVVSTWDLNKPHVGPAFYGTGETPDRQRPVLTFTGGSTGWAGVYKIEHITDNIVRYYIRIPDAAIIGGGNIGDVIASTKVSIGNDDKDAGKEDWLTIKGAPHSRHNGIFKIYRVSSIFSGTFTLDVVNPNISTPDYNDGPVVGIGDQIGLAGIFTDQIQLSSTSPFTANDCLISSAWDAASLPIVLSTLADTIVVGQLYHPLELSPGLVIAGRRTSATIPLRTGNGTAASSNIVVGDTLTCSDFDRPLQVLYVNVAPDSEGNLQSVPNSITVDEAFTWEDNLALPTELSVAGRWVPAEVPTPDATDVLLPKTIVQHLSANPYDDQPFLRSAMVQNNLYLTNGNDEVYKYDGYNFYRAGIIPWQPGLFLTTETTASGGIPLAAGVANDGGGGNVLDLVGTRIKIDKAQGEYFSVNDLVIIQDGTISPVINHYLTIKSRELETSGNHYYFTFKEPLPFTTLGSGSSVKMITTYQARYYFRLNIKDENGVTTASAVTGAEDFVAVIAPTTATQYKINLRLLGLPAWDQYDYSNKNIEIETYRTLWTTANIGEVPVFYRLPQVKVATFVGPDGYLDIVDTYSNNTLSTPDVVVGSLSPEVIPAAWNEPPTAKYVTTAGNRLVLANLTDWPTMNIAYIADTTTQATFAGQKFTFRRNSKDTTPSPTTDMLNYVSYELRNAGSVLLSNITPTAGQFTFTMIPTREIVPGDWVYLFFSDNIGGHPLSICGWWQVSSATAYTSGSPVTCTVKCNGTIVAPVLGTHPVSALFATTPKDVPVNIGIDYNMSMFNGTTVNFAAPISRVIRRIGLAINATMRMADVTITGQSAFKPWLIARSESDTQGQLVVSQPRAEALLPAVSISQIANINTYVNSSPVTSGSTITAAALTRYPSRLAVSYENYPEIFDNLWTVNPDTSASIIDVNSADGQEITGVIPFFGESAFGSALQSGVLVVFKQNSIYLVDLAAKAAGQNAVQRLETQGLGCTAPYSIAPTKDGIAFANDSGIYVLRRNQRIEYLGRFVERLWQRSVRKDFLDIVQGHHYSVGRQYKLSVPMVGEGSLDYAENSQVYVYNHTGETADETGGWGRYTNHPATGWANLFQDAFYATANGSVMRLRNLGEEYDYQDGSNVIESILDGRATAFGNTAVRKVVASVVVNYRSGSNSDNTSVETSVDLNREYADSTAFRVVTQPGVVDGLSTVPGQEIVSIMHSIGRRRCMYMAVRITNTGRNENVEIAGFSYTVAGLSGAGVKQAAETE